MDERPRDSADTSCLSKPFDAGIARELFEQLKALVRGDLELWRSALRNPAHDRHVPLMRERECEVCETRRDEALLGILDAFARSGERVRELLKAFDRDCCQEHVLVLEVPIRSLVADVRAPRDLAECHLPCISALRDHAKHDVHQSASEIAVVVAIAVPTHRSMLTSVNIEVKIERVVNMETRMKTETREIATKVGSLHVESTGTGRAVFCWPSLYCDATTLEPLVRDLARDHRVVVVDGPGHGRSGPSPGPFTMDDCADAAIEVLDALGIERVSWVGPAWGGHVGVVAARRHRDRLDGLAILNAPMAPWRGTKRALMRLSHTLLSIFGPRSFIAPIIADKMIGASAPNRAALVDIMTTALRRCDKRGLLSAAHSGMFGRGDLVPLLGDVHVPTLFFAGAEDELFPVEEAKRQAGAIPNCRFIVVEKSSHQSALEAPEQVVSVLRAALADWKGPCSTENITTTARV